MKTKFLTTVIIFIAYSFCSSFLGQEIKDEQHYGQKPPGKTPEIYSPKFSFLKGETNYDIVLSPDGREACYMVEDTSSKERYDRNFIYYTQMENGIIRKSLILSPIKGKVLCRNFHLKAIPFHIHIRVIFGRVKRNQVSGLLQ